MLAVVMRNIPLLLFAAWLFTSVAIAGPMEDGKKAYDSQDYEHAFHLLLPSANQGNVEAQLCVGQLYEAGAGVKKDETEAMKWFRKAADQKSVYAQILISEMFAKGVGVIKDEKQAEYWRELANDKKDESAPYRHIYVPPPFMYTPPNGLIPNQATAIQVGEAILKGIYGENNIRRQEPFSAVLDGDVWIVKGGVYSGKWREVGGVGVIRLSKSKGCVLSFSHGM